MPQPVGPVTAEALAVERQRLERIAHNLANLHTPAFRPSGLAVSSHSFDAAVRGSAATAAAYPHSTAQDGASPAALRATGRALDIALGIPLDIPGHPWTSLDTPWASLDIA